MTVSVSHANGGAFVLGRQGTSKVTTQQELASARVVSGAPALGIANVEVVYNDVVLVLRGVSLAVPEGRIVALLGANGAGKTTLLSAVTGLLGVHRGKVTKGTVHLAGRDVTEADPADRVRSGLTLVMEGRRIFSELTVEENLRTG